MQLSLSSVIKYPHTIAVKKVQNTEPSHKRVRNTNPNEVENFNLDIKDLDSGMKYI